ncbi:MAG TPA: hypothetical protein GX505_07890 [Clostridiales bacterium]|nr:hypothetical protein [Clostridiales bacterium]
MKILNHILIFLHAFVGIGAIAGGLAAIINPYEPMGITTDVLKNSPFNDFLIPGIILFIIIGLGNIVSAVVLGLDYKYKGYVCSIFSWALVIWIVVQCIMLYDVVALHVIYFIIGLVMAALSAMILFHKRQFPANIILNFLGK